MKEEKISKFLSYVLRHKPEKININLDEQGFVSVNTLLQNANEFGNIIFNHNDLINVVKNNGKKRFEIIIKNLFS